MLADADRDIKDALQTNSADYDKCLAAMSKLETMHISGILLRKNPYIVATIKKVGGLLFYLYSR